MQFNIYNAKTHLSELVNRALDGEEIVIARNGKPVVRIVPEPPKKNKPRVPGLLKGQIWMRDDFDAPLPDSFWLGEE